MNGRLLAPRRRSSRSAAIVLTARVAYVQLVDAEHYRAEARNEHFGQQEVRAPRGAILDRNGYPLATTVDAFDVFDQPRGLAEHRRCAQGGRSHRARSSTSSRTSL